MANGRPNRLGAKFGEEWGSTLAELVEGMQRKGCSEADLKKLVMKDCLEFPELLCINTGRKLLLKSMLGSKTVGALRRFYLTFR